MSQRTIECECRKALPVPEDTSAPLRCSCGRPAIIPPPEEFESRRVVVSAPTLERRIRRLVAAELLPPHRECAWCGSVHAGLLDVHLVCEPDRDLVTGGSRFPLASRRSWAYWWEVERIDRYGGENTVPVPLAACEWCARGQRMPKRSMVAWALGSIAVAILAVGIGSLFSGVGLLLWRAMFVGLWAGAAWRNSSYAARWQRDFKDKLRQVPVYSQLLQEYPHAAVMLPVWVWVEDRPQG
jgi:hypothetical protein